MWTILGTLGSAVIGGISDHFKDKRELKKVEVETKKKVLIARAEAEVEMAKNGQHQDYDLDKIAVEDMRRSWKDEFVMLVFYTPLILVFVPECALYIQNGFKVLDTLPEWYMYLVIGITVVIMGMRGMLSKALNMLGKKLKITK